MANQFVLSDIDFQQFQQAAAKKSSPAAVIKEEEDIPREDLFFFNPPDMTYNAVGNFEVVGNTLSIPDTSGFTTMPFSEEQMNQLLMSTAGDENFTKIPIDFGNIFKVNGVKAEPPITSHYVKYRADQNGKHTKIWECGICRKEFGHQYILMRHLPTHTDERKFQCKQCGKAFRQMSTLSQHRAIHSKLRPYVCEVCQKTFNRVSTLISHRKTHTGLKPHRCHLCNKAFHQKGNLRNHIFTHTNERPYKCDVCHKGFNQMSNLMCHKLKAHQRADKPKYNCQTCGKEFQKRIGLRNHEQYEHGEAAPPVNTVSVNVPNVKYTNGVLVSPITTAAMKHAAATGQVPFALLRPLNGIPVLVRVLPAGDRQMLVPATAEDLKQFGEITIKNKEEEENNVKKENGNGDSTVSTAPNASVLAVNAEEDKNGATVQIRIPVVASVVQRCRDGTMHMDIESPGPKREGQEENYIVTTTDAFRKPDLLISGNGAVPNDDAMENAQLEHKLEDDLQMEEIVIDGDAEDSSNEMRFFDLTGIADETSPKHNGMVLPNFSLNRNSSIEIFDSDMDLSMNTPIINLDDDQEGVVLEEIIPNNIFSVTDTNSNVPIYEIIETSEDGTIKHAEKLLRAFDNGAYHRQNNTIGNINDSDFEICID